MVASLRQAGVAVALGLALACGGSDGPTTPPTTTPPTTLPAPSVILQGSQSIEAFYLWAWDFTTSRAGTIDITIDYTYTSNVILVWSLEAPVPGSSSTPSSAPTPPPRSPAASPGR
jgi:hypothetical protein